MIRESSAVQGSQQIWSRDWYSKYIVPSSALSAFCVWMYWVPTMSLQDRQVWYYRQGRIIFLRIIQLSRDGASIPSQSGWLENLHSHQCSGLILYFKFYSLVIINVKAWERRSYRQGKISRNKSRQSNTGREMTNK